MIHTGSREERAAFSTHFQKLSEEYGSRVVILSTLNDAGAEGILNLKYSREARRSEKIQLFKHFRFFSVSNRCLDIELLGVGVSLKT